MNIACCHIARLSLPAITLIAFTACGGTGSGRAAAGLNTTYKVGGTVSGLIGQGLTIELLNPATPAHHTTILEQIDIVANGAFVFRIPPSQGYGVAIVHQPHAPMQRCVVRSGHGVIGTTDVSNVDIVCGDLI
jgi:6-phosphogluconolactonase